MCTTEQLVMFAVIKDNPQSCRSELSYKASVKYGQGDLHEDRLKWLATIDQLLGCEYIRKVGVGYEPTRAGLRAHKEYAEHAYRMISWSQSIIHSPVIYE